MSFIYSDHLLDLSHRNEDRSMPEKCTKMGIARTNDTQTLNIHKISHTHTTFYLEQTLIYIYVQPQRTHLLTLPLSVSFVRLSTQLLFYIYVNIETTWTYLLWGGSCIRDCSRLVGGYDFGLYLKWIEKKQASIPLCPTAQDRSSICASLMRFLCKNALNKHTRRDQWTIKLNFH